MKRDKTILLYISICFSLFPLIPTYSQSDSLTRYLEIASERNQGLIQKYSEYRAALEQVPQAGSLRDPELSIGVFLTPMELLSGKQYADIRLMQMFPWFGTLKNAKDEMSMMAMSKFETYRDARLRVFYEVQKDWYEMNRNYESIRILEGNVQLLKTIERLALTRYKSDGPVSQSMNPGSVNTGGSGLAGIYMIQIEELDLENEIAMLKDEEKSIMARFNGYLDKDPEMPVILPDTIIADTVRYQLLQSGDTLLSGSPMLGMLRYEQQSLESRKKMVKLMGYPMAGLGLNYSVIGKSDMSTSSMNGRDMIMPMISITLPVYRKKYNSMRREVEYLETASKAGYQEALRNLQTEYVMASESFRDAGRRLKLYRAQKDLAQKSLDIMLKSYASSAATLADILSARKELKEYELKLLQAVADYNTSIAMLQRLTTSGDKINKEKSR